jgi:hypothetical protein
MAEHSLKLHGAGETAAPNAWTSRSRRRMLLDQSLTFPIVDGSRRSAIAPRGWELRGTAGT